MASTFPRYRLYASDGVTLIYDFENVLDDGGIFQDPSSFTEHTSLRGQGSIIIPGSDQPSDITLNFLLIGANYEELVDKMLDARDAIVKFTRYILKVELTSGGATENLKVMRLQPIQWPNQRRRKRVTLQDGIITLRVLTWA